MGFISALFSVTVYLVRGHYVRGIYNCVNGMGYRLLWEGYATQVLVNWVERWSFVSMGEDSEINYYDYENCYIL